MRTSWILGTCTRNGRTRGYIWERMFIAAQFNIVIQWSSNNVPDTENGNWFSHTEYTLHFVHCISCIFSLICSYGLSLIPKKEILSHILSCPIIDLKYLWRLNRWLQRAIQGQLSLYCCRLNCLLVIIWEKKFMGL